MLHGDLAAAGIPYRDVDNRVADFHSLRHSFVTMLSRSGVHPKTAQELARHSTIDLTMNVYTHARLSDLGAAVEGLPSLLPSAAANLAATGTEGTTRESFRKACAKGGTGRQGLGVGERTVGTDTQGVSEPQTLCMVAIESDEEDPVGIERKLPGLDSNQDKENQNPIVVERKSSRQRVYARRPKTLARHLARKPGFRRIQARPASST
jgi:hypothetical protein